ncbi:ABC transporter permease [Sphaerobacter sp.]|uniref:ABC transporter permease n=1 Tax=Sphaerobacter sp. TaxID=2099654 RepID=UPI001D563A95|nr:ABC transporter permease [Sphaerobacter sp.]MBX5444769.1 ABC transporter permease [Sphaerobacter sp.]
MGQYVVRRVIQIVPLVLGITIITFALANLVPGSPISDLEFNPQVRPEDRERIAKALGLDQPLHVRYVQWLSHVARGDLGLSLITYQPVMKTIMEKLPNTLLLTVTALILSLIVAIPVGVYGAVRRNSAFDQVTTVGAVAGFAMPTFWLGLMVILILVRMKGAGLPTLPTGGVCELGNCTLLSRVQHLIAPAFVLAFVQTATWTRYIRSQMIEVLRQDYMRTAEAKGLREVVIIFRHGLRNAILPLVTLLALDLPTLFSGSVIVEQIFTWNGLGRLILDSVNKRDYTMVMGVTLFVSVLTVVANLLADIVYGVLDPRIRYD